MILEIDGQMQNYASLTVEVSPCGAIRIDTDDKTHWYSHFALLGGRYPDTLQVSSKYEITESYYRNLYATWKRQWHDSNIGKYYYIPFYSPEMEAEV